MLSADILLKGLGGLAVVGGATTVGVCYKQEKWIFAKKKVETLEELAGKVGLSCKGTSNTEPTETNGVVCSKGTGDTVKVKVKRDNETFDISTLPATGGGKIKVYKTSEGEKHNNGFKFVVEEGDVSGDNSKKLEEFETYEIKEDEGNNKEWRLTKKTDVNTGIKKALGLPDDEKCNLPTTTTPATECDISGDKFKKINFEGGDENKSVTGAPKLKISKVEDSNSDYGTYKFKFVLESAQDATISKTVTIKKGTNTEFKIKANPASGGPKTLTLEKAWTLETLGAKVGLKECGTGNNTPKECGFDTSTKVNLFNGANDYTKGATVKSEDASKKIKVEEEQEGYSQGFKFYAEENNEITLENGTPNQGNGEKKITKKETSNNSPTYEIKEQNPTESGAKDWYLSKVTKTQGT